MLRGPAVRGRAASRTSRSRAGRADPGAALRAARRGRRLPLLVYLHGAAGSCATSTRTTTCAGSSRSEAGVLVLSVDYRLAPEHPFPAAVDDSLAAFRFAVENALRARRRSRAVAVGGDSAGGNLAAVVSQLAVADGGPVPAFCLSIYPVTDLSEKRDSYRLFSEGFLLTEAPWTGTDRTTCPTRPRRSTRAPRRCSPRTSPGCRPTYIATAGFDPLRDEGEEYARRLREAGVPGRTAAPSRADPRLRERRRLDALRSRGDAGGGGRAAGGACAVELRSRAL